MKIEQYFAEKLREVILNKGRGSQAALGRAMGVTGGTINNIVKGRRGTGEETRRKVSLLMGMDYDGIVQEYLRLYPHQPISGTSSSTSAPDTAAASAQITTQQCDQEPSFRGEDGSYYKKLNRILGSEKFRSAISHNLVAFSRAIETEEEMGKMQNDMKEMIEALNNLTAEIKSLKEQLPVTKKESIAQNE